MELLIAFVAGLIVMDLLWAWRTGLLAYLIMRVKQRFGLGKVDTGSDRL